MQGRIEDNFKILKTIEQSLNNVPEYVIEWYHNLRASNIEPSSCLDYIRKIKNYLNYINYDITLPNTEKYFIFIQTKKDTDGNIIGETSGSYQQGIWTCLNNFFDFMVKRNYLKDNYINSISKPKNNDLNRINQNRIRLTKYDFNKIINSVEAGVGTNKAKQFQKTIKYRDLLIMMLFMTTGMRKTALHSINIEDIDLDNGYIYIIDKGDKYHKYILNDITRNYLTNWIEQRNLIDGNTNALFISEKGNRLSGNAIYKLVSKYSEDALGYHISPHKLRAGFCSILYEETGDAEFVRRSVGHSNIQTTQRYIVTDNKEKERASNIMASIFI